MADIWEVVCMDCLEALRVGKAVWIDEQGQRVDPRFWVAERVASHEQQLKALERFLGLHLGHVLGTLTSAVIIDEIEPWDADDQPIRSRQYADLEADSWREAPDPAQTTAASLLHDRLRQYAGTASRAIVKVADKLATRHVGKTWEGPPTGKCVTHG